ncbi:hypothetical protein WL05_07150 [Burkholderia ubonensis]|nr:hypothetical protein WJ51_21450 [Burkholderia ubonensis]KVM53649.1 hypothetical protein WJ56_00570 [Burkholderia ubonensis]KVX55199.1 hypothetical protein WL05_07150 [Burkholderia ubonensis]KVX98243.1 hypothetical protein WL10_32585 [Burkholderia ubonensis]KWD15024.1 hypothetical protein WL59_29290 [Burkholderia ubonensis]
MVCVFVKQFEIVRVEIEKKRVRRFEEFKIEIDNIDMRRGSQITNRLNHDTRAETKDQCVMNTVPDAQCSIRQLLAEIVHMKLWLVYLHSALNVIEGWTQIKLALRVSFGVTCFDDPYCGRFKDRIHLLFQKS